MRRLTHPGRAKAFAFSVLALFAAGPAMADDLTTATRQKARDLLQDAYARYGGEQQAAAATAEIAEAKLGMCRYCHGADGNSTKSGLPSLAGERPEYLLQRMMRLKQGDQESRTCSRSVRRLNRDQMVALAFHFSGEHRYPVDFDADLAVAGKPLFEQYCQQCHLANGSGKPGMPVIAGQQPDYLARSLVHFRDHPGWRHVDEMPPQAQRLAPVEIKAVAAYAASLAR